MTGTGRLSGHGVNLQLSRRASAACQARHERNGSGSCETDNGYARRVDEAMLGEVAWSAEQAPHAFVCGPTSFVETVASGLVALGYPSHRIRTERFGATGGH